MSQMLFMSTIPVALLCASMDDGQPNRMKRQEIARMWNDFEFYWNRPRRWHGSMRVRLEYTSTGKIRIPPFPLFCGSHRLPGSSTLMARHTCRSSTTPVRGMTGMAAYRWSSRGSDLQASLSFMFPWVHYRTESRKHSALSRRARED